MPDTTTSPPLDWFPVDAAKTLSHQDLLGLKLPELGAFWLLRLFCWKDGSVPASPKRLAVLCRSTENQMARMVERLSHLLEPHPERPDRLVMPLVEADRPEGYVLPAARPSIDLNDSSPPERAIATAKPPPAKRTSAPIPGEMKTAIAHREPPSAAEPKPAAAPTTAQEGEPKPPEPKPPEPKPAPEPAPPTTEHKPRAAPELPSDEYEERPSPEDKRSPRMMSLFAQQESVFDAHDFGLCVLSEALGEPERYKPERHYRMKASRRRIVSLAITMIGVDGARRAARNVPLSLHLFDENDKFHALDIERAFRNCERSAGLFIGSDDDFVNAVRERWRSPDLERQRLLKMSPAPWEPPQPGSSASTSPQAESPATHAQSPEDPPPAGGPQQSTIRELTS